MNEHEPEPDAGTRSPLIGGDPFWGEPPYTHAYLAIGAIVAGFLLAIALVVWGVTSAGAASFADGPQISCTTISIDPTSSWINVTFDGNVNGKNFEVAAPYDGNVHLASADFSQETSSTGELRVTAVAHSDFGFGPVTSNVVSVTLTCHQSPPTSVSTTSTTRPVPSTTTTTATAQRATSPTSPTTVGAVAVSAPALPRTGSSSETLAIVGLVTLLAGSATLAHTRRKIR